MIELIIFLRLIPYVMSAIIAHQKGFPRLTAVALIAIASTLYQLTLPTPHFISILISTAFSVALLFHALDLKSRKGGN